MKKIIYRTPDGRLAVVHPNPNAKREDESDDKFVERIRLSDVPADARDVRVVEPSAIPADRSFRDAWTLGVDGVEVDEVQKAQILAQLG
jgi:hypothetical protein